MLEGGSRHLGWKAGFGAPASLERYGLGGPLVGFMTDGSLLPGGAEVDISGWGRAVAEPELAVYFGSDVPAGGDETSVRAAVSAVGPAIELANIDPPPEDVEEILAGNIFHEGVILGPADPGRAGANLAGLEARVKVDGEDRVRTAALEELTGRIDTVVSHLSALLVEHGEEIRAGDVLICGSVVPPIELSSGMTVGFELYPMTPISVIIA